MTDSYRIVGTGWPGIIVPDSIVMPLRVSFNIKVLQIQLRSGLEIVMLVHHGAVRIAVGCRPKNALQPLRDVLETFQSASHHLHPLSPGERQKRQGFYVPFSM